jgi:hypothetical protein
LKILNGLEPIEKCVICRNTAAESDVVWNCLPVPAFGNPKSDQVKVATIGLNPALNEPRLPRLADYGKKSREELTDANVKDSAKCRENYFIECEKHWHNYFETLDSFLGRVNHLWSYARNVVHIDLVACATKEKFAKTNEKSREILITNCRRHFLRTLIQLPKEAMLLLDGRAVCDNLLRLGRVNFDVGPELILITPRVRVKGLCGSITINERQFKFRGWNMPVGKLNRLQRIDLAIWLRRHSS